MEVTGAFLFIKLEEFPVLIDLIGLIISTDFNRLSIDLKFVIIGFRISADSSSTVQKLTILMKSIVQCLLPMTTLLYELD